MEYYLMSVIVIWVGFMLYVKRNPELIQKHFKIKPTDTDSQDVLLLVLTLCCLVWPPLLVVLALDMVFGTLRRFVFNK